MRLFLLIYAAVALSALMLAQPPIPEKETYFSPFDAVKIAAEDSVAITVLNDPSINPKRVRYLSLHDVPKARRPIVKAVLDYVLNSLNPHTRRILRTASLPATSDDPIVVRVNLADYGIRNKSWDYLIENGSSKIGIPEPFFNERLEEVTTAIKTETIDEEVEEKYTVNESQPTGQYFQGRPIYKEVAVQKVRKVKKQVAKQVKADEKKKDILAAAGWLSLEPDVKGYHVTGLIKNLNAKYPMANAQWFITYATWAPAYYELIGLELKENPVAADRAKTPKVYLEKDFENIFGFDEKLAKLDVVAGVADTKLVALHNRILERYSTVRGITGGAYWRSRDTANGIDDADYLNTLGKFDTPKIDAQEIIASGRNQLNFYALTDNKGRLLDVAAADVAQHSQEMPTKWRDNQIYSGRNCMLCHAGGQIQIKDRVRNIARGKIALLIKDKTQDRVVALKIEEAFSPNLKAIIDHDNAKYAAAVLAAGGKDTKVIGKEYEQIVYDYYYAPVTLEKMGREAGIAPKELERILKRGKDLDHNIVAILQDPPEDVYRTAWERQGYSALMRYLLTAK